MRRLRTMIFRGNAVGHLPTGGMSGKAGDRRSFLIYFSKSVAYRLDSCNKMFVEIREILGTKKYMNQESAIIAGSDATERRRRAAGARNERRAIPRDRSRRRPIPRGRSRSSSLATVRCAGEIRPQAVGVLAQHEREAEGQCCSEGDCDGQVG